MADYQLFTRGARSAFLQGLREADDMYKRLVKVVPSDRQDETYDSFSPAPRLREMTDSAGFESQVGVSFNYTLTNQSWGIGVKVTKDAFDDDKMGAYRERIRQLGSRTRQNMFRQILQTLWDGDGAASYDGSNFFAAAHNDWTGDNAITSAAAAGDAIPTLSEFEIAYEDARALFLEFTDGMGEPIWWDHNDLALICGPRMETVANRVLKNPLRTSGESQIHKGDAEIIVTPVTNDTGTVKEFALVRLTPDSQPLILQERTPPREVTEDQVEDEMLFFGVKQRFTVGYYRPYSAIHQVFTT